MGSGRERGGDERKDCIEIEWKKEEGSGKERKRGKYILRDKKKRKRKVKRKSRVMRD